MDYSKKLLQRIINFEDWITRYFKGDMPNEFPKELNVLYSENPTAYFYYRANLYKIAQTMQGGTKLLNEFNELLSDAQKANQRDYDVFFNYYSESSFVDEFIDIRRNSVEVQDEIKNPVVISQQACFLYQSLYEIDAPFYILGVASELAKNGNLNLHLNNLQDRGGYLKKGVAIEYINSRLSNYPILKESFSKAYNSKLRNTIGHNKYRRFDFEIKSLDGRISIGISEFFEALYSIQSLENAMINSMSLLQMESEVKDIVDCGILAIAFSEYEDGTPVLALFQLWCFYNLDKDKNWLNRVKFERNSNKTLETRITKNAYQEGIIDDNVEMWLKKANARNKIEIAVSPIFPRMSENGKIIDTDFGEFEVGKDIQIKFVDVEIINAQ